MLRFGRHTLMAMSWRCITGPVLIAILLILCQGIHAQSTIEKRILDSLAYIADTAVGEEKVDALLILERKSHDLKGNNIGYKQISICKEALLISQEITYLKGELGATIRLVYNFNKKGLFRDALIYSNRYLSLTSLDTDTIPSNNIMAIYKQISISYRGLEMNDSAYYYLKESLDIAKKVASCKTIANLQLEMGKLFSLLVDHESELQAYLDGYHIIKDCPDTNSRSEYAVYSRVLGYYFMTHGNYKEALKYFLEADSLYGSMDSEFMRYLGYHAMQASNIARVYQHWGKLDSAMIFRRLAVERFFDYGFNERNINIPNQYCYIGMLYREQGDFISAREYLEKSLTLRKSNGDSLGVGMCLDEMAILAKLSGNYQIAVQLLVESLIWKNSFVGASIDPRRKAQWLESQSETYLIMGQVFADWNKFDDAFMYYDTALVLYRQVGYLRGEAQVEYYRGMAWEASGYPDTAMKHIEHSLSLAVNMNNRPLIAQAKAGLGNLYSETGNMLAGLEMYNEALEIYLEDEFTRTLPNIYLSRGEIHYNLGSSAQATGDLEQAYQRAKKMGMIRIQADAAFILAEIYTQLDDHLSAYQYLKEYTTLHDSVFTLEAHKQLAEMQAMHASQQQELEITRLEQDNEINSLRVDRSRYVIISMGGVLIIILLFAVLFLRQIQIRNEQRALLNQQKLFRSQMNPHFIFNSLTNIQHYIFSKDSLTAGKYLAVFAKLMRSILNNSRKEMITLRDEIDTIQQYLELQQLRMEDKLDFSVELDEMLDQEITEIPPMLAQPFIENAIEHGIRNKEGRGLVSVRINAENKHILYEVEDDGVGRKRVAEIQKNKKKDHESMAVSLTRTRLLTLWGRRKPEKIFEIIDLADGDGNACGTLVRFKIPL